MSNCPACDSSVVVVEYQGSYAYNRSDEKPFLYSFVHCRTCGLSWITPLPPAAVVQALYPAAYRLAQGTGETAAQQYNLGKLWLARARYDRPLLGRWIASVIEWVSGRVISPTLGIPLQFPLNARILDVGCGGGGYLLGMRRMGYTNLYGQDIDDTCRSRLEDAGIQFAQGALGQVDFPAGRFDLVRLEHVFEHLPDPMAVLLAIRHLLKPEGVLVMAVPNIGSLSYALSGLDWHALELPRHLYHYTPQALRHLGRRSGFSVVSIRHLPVWQQMTRSWECKVGSALARRILRHPAIYLLSPFWGVLVRVLRRGDFMAVVMQPMAGNDE